MKEVIKTGLVSTAVEALVHPGPAGGGKKQHYYVEYTGRDANGDEDTVGTGTMKIEGKLREGGGWEEISATTDLTTGDFVFEDFTGHYHTLRFTPDSLEADHSVDVYVLAVDD